MTIVFARRALAAATLAIVASGIGQQSALAQVAARSASPTHVLANATKPTDLDFEGGECELAANGNKMSCIFQQVFLTTSDVAPDTCLITTNRYQRVFDRDSVTRWVSTEGPEGVCGLLDVATLQDDGGVRWTMETRKVATKKDASPMCRTMDSQLEVLSWQNIRRSLPCRFVQPGGLR